MSSRKPCKIMQLPRQRSPHTISASPNALRASFHQVHDEKRHCVAVLRILTFLVQAVALELVEVALQRKVMHLYATSSDWQALVRQYEQLEATLHREMYMAPDQKTRELYQRLMASRNGPMPESSRSSKIATRS